MKDNRKRFLLRRRCITSSAEGFQENLRSWVRCSEPKKDNESLRPDVHALLIFPNVSWKEILQEIRCLMHNAVAALVYLALSWSWKNRSELEIHAERLEENDSCDDGMSLTLEEKLHKRPLTAVLHLLLLYCVLKFPDLFSTMPWTSSFLYATHCGKSLFSVSKFNFW